MSFYLSIHLYAILLPISQVGQLLSSLMGESPISTNQDSYVSKFLEKGIGDLRGTGGRPSFQGLPLPLLISLLWLSSY